MFHRRRPGGRGRSGPDRRDVAGFVEQMRPFANLAPNAKPVGADFLALPGNRGLREFFDLRFPLITQTPGGTQSPNDAYANSFAQIIEKIAQPGNVGRVGHERYQTDRAPISLGDSFTQI